jgi:hypothetical protein
VSEREQERERERPRERKRERERDREIERAGRTERRPSLPVMKRSSPAWCQRPHFPLNLFLFLSLSPFFYSRPDPQLDVISWTTSPFPIARSPRDKKVETYSHSMPRNPSLSAQKKLLNRICPTRTGEPSNFDNLSRSRYNRLCRKC